MKKVIVFLSAVCVSATFGACREWEPPTFEIGPAPLPNVTLGDLRTYLNAEAETTLTDDIVVVGRVVSSDGAGNFHNTFFIDDGTGAAEIMAGMSGLDAVYRPGQRVEVRLRGLAVGWRDGAMQIGLPPEPGNRYATGYFYHRTVISRWVTAARDVEPVAPLEVSLADLSREMCGRLVRVAGMRAEEAAVGGAWAVVEPTRQTGYVKFRAAGALHGAGDLNGAGDLHGAGGLAADSLTVVTSGYASWAAGAVPSEEVSLIGILFWGTGEGPRNHFLLKLRDENDIVY